MDFNSFQEKRLTEMIQLYRTGPRQPMELEVRFPRPDEDTFKKVLVDFTKAYPKATQSTEQIISFMTDSTKKKTGNYFDRKELYFKDGTKSNINHNRKFREQMLKIYGITREELYRISLASEEPIAEFPANNAHRIRLRMRCSVMPDLGAAAKSDWRFDFTAAVQLEKYQFDHLKPIKDKLFPSKKITPSNFLEHISNVELPEDIRFTYEFEIEYIGDVKNLSIDSIKYAVHDFTKILQPNFESVSNYQNTIYEIASKLIKDQRLLGLFKTKFGLKKLANQPHNLTKATFNKILPNIADYYASDKADGERCFVQVFNDAKDNPAKVMIVLSDRVLDMSNVFLKKPSTSLKSKDESDTSFSLVFDAEIVNLDRDAPEKSKHPIIYLFDILIQNGKSVAKEPYEKRQALLDPYPKNKDFKSIEKKILVRLTADSYAKQLEDLYKRKTRAYNVDGWVLTPVKAQEDHSTYSESIDYFDHVVYKLKPPEMMTADFLILKPPDKIIGQSPYIAKPGHTLYFLFSGIGMNDSKILGLPDISGYDEMTKDIPIGNYFPVQFAPSSHPYAYMFYCDEKNPLCKDSSLHKQVGEFFYDVRDASKPEDLRWRLEKLRPDKTALAAAGTSFGNSFRVAEEVFMNYFNPLSLDYIKESVKKDATSGQYFQETKLEEYKPLTKLNNFVKAQLIRQIQNKSWVVDLAGGQGQDLFTYNGFEVKNGLFIDIDYSALEELNRRKWNLGNTRAYVFSRAPRTNIRIHTMQADLTKPAAEHIKAILDRGFPLPQDPDSKETQFLADAVVINLAIHYMADSKKSLENIVELATRMLKPGGVFIVTTFDGGRVFDLLKNTATGQSFDIPAKTTGNTGEAAKGNTGEAAKGDTGEAAKGNTGEAAKAAKANPPKYSIKKKYKEKTFKTGLQIGVIHPFSKGEYYDEYLVDIDELVAIGKDKGLKLQQRGSFGDWNDKFSKFNPKFYKMLTSDDKKYGAMYSFISFFK